MQLHETGLGRRFFESQLPKLIKELSRIADALEKQNEIKQEVKKNDLFEKFLEESKQNNEKKKEK